MVQNMTDTIAAVSTAVSEAGIGIIRMSGKDSVMIADKVYQGRNHKKLIEQKSHTIHYGYIIDQGDVVDEVLVMLMLGPHSYTGEDTVEIDCHGGIYVVKKILEILLKNGARAAEPGEFTKRAFLNGRMDLSQAEAVIDIIQAKNNYALKSSVNQLKGSLKKRIGDIRNKIIYHTAYIESALDDPEHMSIDGYGDILKSSVKEIQGEIHSLIDSFDDGRIMKEGVNTVIVGKPNAGKSSLLNALLKEDRAIVTDVAGTTRDVLEESLNLQGMTLNILDTAGIRDTSDIVEKLGVDRAKMSVEKADLIIFVIDASAPLDYNDYRIFEMIREKRAIILLNKTDLEVIVKKDEITSLNESAPIIEVSAKENKGIRVLEETIKDMFYRGKISFNTEVYITNIRHKEALKGASESLNRVFDSIESGVPEDFYSIDLMDAYELLGSITGDRIGEDLIHEIFSKFCMGK